MPLIVRFFPGGVEYTPPLVGSILRSSKRKKMLLKYVRALEEQILKRYQAIPIALTLSEASN